MGEKIILKRFKNYLVFFYHVMFKDKGISNEDEYFSYWRSFSISTFKKIWDLHILSHISWNEIELGDPVVSPVYSISKIY